MAAKWFYDTEFKEPTKKQKYYHPKETFEHMPVCNFCKYRRKISGSSGRVGYDTWSVMTACHYILDEGHSRDCEPEPYYCEKFKPKSERAARKLNEILEACND